MNLIIVLLVHKKDSGTIYDSAILPYFVLGTEYSNHIWSGLGQNATVGTKYNSAISRILSEGTEYSNRIWSGPNTIVVYI